MAVPDKEYEGVFTNGIVIAVSVRGCVACSTLSDLSGITAGAGRMTSSQILRPSLCGGVVRLWLRTLTVLNGPR